MQVFGLFVFLNAFLFGDSSRLTEKLQRFVKTDIGILLLTKLQTLFEFYQFVH